MKLEYNKQCGKLSWHSLLLCVYAALPPPRERSFTFEYAVTVKDVPGGAHTVDIWLPAPHDDAFQRITNLRVDTPYHYEIATGTEGNRILHIRGSRSERAGHAVTMRFDAVRKEHIQPLRRRPCQAMGRPPDWPARLDPLSAARPPGALDDTIRRWAREVVDAAGAKTDLEMARAIYNHVVAP
jgi:hypothetical protein